MLYLSEVRDFIAGLLTGIVDDENVYSGIMQDKQEMSVGVYNQKRGTPKLSAVGVNPSYSRKAVSVLRCNRTSRENQSRCKQYIVCKNDNGRSS